MPIKQKWKFVLKIPESQPKLCSIFFILFIFFIYTFNKYSVIGGTTVNKINKVFFLRISLPLYLIFQIYHIEANAMIIL